MRKDTIFKLGDRVYAPFHGYGVVTKIHDDNCAYPIEVTWDSCAFEKREDVSTFTANGSLVQDTTSPAYTLTVVESAMPKDAEEDERMKTKLKVGDKVYSPHYGWGIVTEISDATNSPYPVEVHWTGAVPISSPECDYFTKEGWFQCSSADPEYDIVSLKVTKVSEDFKVGDRVYFNSNGYGTITRLTQSKTEQYPIEVKWDDTNITSTFTKDGYVWSCHTANDPKLSVVNKANRLAKDMSPEDRGADEMGQITGVIHHNDDGVADRMMDALAKRQDDAINPSHYKVKGLPEAIDIINHLMHREQLEGFLWGNILKYTYRYGRKGDKAETAGKIEWYAKQLKELCECEAEESDKK